MQLERLLKDPSKPAYIPAPPKEKAIRPAREMMKNVQGSSAGAGSGEFHVYKASRRREYERLKMLGDEARKEAELSEFEEKRRQREKEAEAKTAKNRAKRQKKKERTRTGKEQSNGEGDGNAEGRQSGGMVTKKRRLVNGAELVFRRPGEESEGEDADEVGPTPVVEDEAQPEVPLAVPAVADGSKITIIEDD